MADLITLTGNVVDHLATALDTIPLEGVTVTASPSREVTQTSDGSDAMTDAATTSDASGDFTLPLVHAAGLRYAITYRVGGRKVVRGTLDCDSWAAGSVVDVSSLPPAAGPPPSKYEELQAWILATLANYTPTGGSGGTVTADDTPAAPAEGASASYLVTSAVTWPAGLVWSTDPDDGTEPTITTTALVSLFTVGGTTYAVMGSTYPVSVVPDTTDPTPGTLTVVTTSTTADLTVTGATDETELDAAPYAYSGDNGATWTAYQAGATYEFTGLTASTSYTFQHRVKDAAGNVATGTAVTESTDAPSSDTTPPTAGTLASSAITSSGFTLTVTGASDETALDAAPYAFSTDNGVTYSAWQASNAYDASGLAASTAYDCVHKVRDAAANVTTGIAIEATTAAATPTTPPDLGWLASWWADDIAATDGDPIATWEDRSGTYDATQGNAARRPIYRAADVDFNGQPVLDFTTVNSCIISGSWTPPATQPLTLVMVLAVPTPSAAVYLADGKTNNLDARLRVTRDATAFSVNGSAKTAPLNELPHAIILKQSTTNGQSYVMIDGTGYSWVLGISFPTALDGLTIGASVSAASGFMGKVAFVGFIAGELTPAQATAFNEWAAAKYGVGS